MAYDEGLAERIREALGSTRNIAERTMFGGLAYMCNGHMFVGILGETQMARVGAERYVQALAQPHVRKMGFTGRPMKGYVFVDPRGLARDADLAEWVKRCLDFVETLPPKTPKQVGVLRHRASMDTDR